MKKLLLMAAFGTAGFMSAKDFSVSKPFKYEFRDQEIFSKKSETVIKQQKPYNLINVGTPCGKPLHLNSEDYIDIYAFLEDVRHFTLIKCGNLGQFAEN